jgi:hypothetical protein
VNLPKAIGALYKAISMKKPNTVFLRMFDWFIAKYGKAMTKDCKASRHRMATEWHSTNFFEPLTMHLFIGASHTSVTLYPMRDYNIIDIDLHVIKRYGMYSEKYKN